MNVILDKQNILPLPVGYTARSGKLEDYKIVFDLLNAHSQHMNGHVDLVDPELLRLDWLNEGFHPETDIRLVFTPDNSLVAFIECWTTQEPPVHPWIFGCVHPAHWGKGIGSHMVTWAEDRASLALDKCAPDLRFAPRSGTEAHNKNGVALFEGLGWKHIRSFYRMVTDLDSAPEIPVLPEGITIRAYDPETELEAVYQTFVDFSRITLDSSSRHMKRDLLSSNITWLKTRHTIRVFGWWLLMATRLWVSVFAVAKTPKTLKAVGLMNWV